MNPNRRTIAKCDTLQGGQQKHRQVGCRGEREPASTNVTQSQDHEVEAARVEVVPGRARGLAVPPRSRGSLVPPEGRTEETGGPKNGQLPS